MREFAEILESKKSGLRSRRSTWREEEVPNKWLWYNERDFVHQKRFRAKTLNQPSPSWLASIYPGRRGMPHLIPSFLTPLTNRIDASRKILQLEENWDEDGSSIYTEATWNRSAKFLWDNTVRLWRRHKLFCETPRMLPGPDGSIDLHWRTIKRELLINIPAIAEEPASYYGDDTEEGTQDAIKGKNLDTSADNEWIFLWLMK